MILLAPRLGMRPITWERDAGLLSLERTLSTMVQSNGCLKIMFVPTVSNLQMINAAKMSPKVS